MNILIPHSWLLEHLDTNATPEEISKHISLCGPSVEATHQREGEAVYEIEVTTNRVDSMSVRGIAREVAVILQQFGKKAKLKELKLKEIETPKPKNQLPLPQIIDDEKLCKRTLAVVLSNIQRTPTPAWMSKRLTQTEMNIHDAVIDITNYITHELGHPCHAFDYDRIMELGGMIIVKEAKPKKRFTTLDGITYTTVGGEIVFENDKGEIIDFPAIKGTANTSINESTKNVLFWIENLDAKKVRFGSMTHAVRTVAAQLNEKNVDPHLAGPVFAKGVELFQQLTHAEVASKVYDSFPAKKKMTEVKVPIQRITDYLGIELPVNTIGQILEDLGCEVDLKGGKETGPYFAVTPPTFRRDIEIPADVIEEIARIYGYHNLPSVLMPTEIPLNKPTDTNFHIENRIKRFLSTIGWQEVYTYSMVSEQIAKQSGYEIDEHLKIQNPLTDDRVYLRRSLIPSLEEVISTNPQRPKLSVFELANLYPPQPKTLPNEKLHLSLVSTQPYRKVKGDVEALLQSLFIKNLKFKTSKQPGKQFTQMAEVSAELHKNHGKKAEQRVIGTIGILGNGHVAMTFVVSDLLHVVHTHPSYQPLPKTSEIIEDLTFTLPPQTEVGPLLDMLKSLSPLFYKVELHDIYNQNYTFTITFHDPQRHLTVEEITPLRKQIVEVMQQKVGATLVGSLSN